MADSERSPLLPGKYDASNGYSTGSSSSGCPSKPQSSVPYPSLEVPCEPPPPYSLQANPDSSQAPVISCRVCRSTISVEGKMHQHVVKCSICNEATAIKNAPPGKKYIRCICNCLLICKVTSQRIACPRPACKRVINLISVHVDGDSTEPQHQPVGLRVICGHCCNTFLWTEISDRTLARCPHCRKVSSIGRRYPRRSSWLSFLLFVVLAASTVGLVVGTWKQAQKSKGIYVAWALLVLLSLFVLTRTIYWRCLKISDPVSNST